eukprot:m51a1_g139 hypothetical protein (121) ;mRNA; f:451055-451417
MSKRKRKTADTPGLEEEHHEDAQPPHKHRRVRRAGAAAHAQTASTASQPGPAQQREARQGTPGDTGAARGQQQQGKGTDEQGEYAAANRLLHELYLERVEREQSVRREGSAAPADTRHHT